MAPRCDGNPADGPPNVQCFTGEARQDVRPRLKQYVNFWPQCERRARRINAGQPAWAGIRGTRNSRVSKSRVVAFASQQNSVSHFRIGSWLCENAATRNRDRINNAPSCRVIHENSKAFPISIDLRKIILVAFQFFCVFTQARSISAEIRCLRYVRSAPNSRLMSDNAASRFRADSVAKVVLRP